jgi:hypothetical protein
MSHSQQSQLLVTKSEELVHFICATLEAVSDAGAAIMSQVYYCVQQNAIGTMGFLAALVLLVSSPIKALPSLFNANSGFLQ